MADNFFDNLGPALSDGGASELLTALAKSVPGAGFAFAESVGGAWVVVASVEPAPPTGTTLPIDAALVPLKSRGQLFGMLHYVRPGGTISDAELRLISRAAPFCASNLAVDRLLRQVGDAQTLEGRLQLLIVHDLKNPLSIVKINLALLLEEPDFDPAEREELVTESLGATDRLLVMLDDLAIIRRAEVAGMTLDVQELELRELLEPAAARAVKWGQSRGVTIAVPTMTGLTRVDMPLTTRAVENILTNAVRYSPDRGEVRVEVMRQATHWRIIIENDGPAIPEKQIPALFEKYGQVDVGSGQRYGGRGLGLYMCRLVVEAHGGTVRVTNRGEVGVRFELTLPAT
jgi:signal transduction histidine kinase